MINYKLNKNHKKLRLIINLLSIFTFFILKNLECKKIDKIILSRNQKIILFYMPSVENLIIALSKALEDIGFENVFISDKISKDEDGLYIILNGAQLQNNQMPKRYIIYQTEQTGSLFYLSEINWFNENYIKNLEQAIAVFDYSLINIENLNKKFAFNINYLPFNYHPVLKKKLLCYQDRSIEADRLRDIDVLFLGCLNNRRLKIKSALEKINLNIYFKDYVTLPQLYELIKRAKIVLNLHFYDEITILETSRLSLLWANQACVVTETSNDIYADNSFKDCACFSSYEDIAIKCKELVDSLDKRIEIAQKGHEIFTKNFLLTDDLKKIFIVTD